MTSSTQTLTRMDRMTGSFIDLAERGLIPDLILRAGIRKLCRDRLNSLRGPTLDAEAAGKQEYIDNLKSAPIAVATTEANEQHYEVPTDFYRIALGKNLKYSSAYFPTEHSTLDEAENAALTSTMDRAELVDGMQILELGCGWGSLTLAMARRYPLAKITAVSNSHTQKEWILNRAVQEKLSNVTVLTRNIAHGLPFSSEFDRVVSVEMFEHMKNYEKLLSEVHKSLKPGGKLFVHIFTHRDFAYPFETEGEDNWMGRHFFTGGQMPSHDLLLYFQNHLQIEAQWAWDGTHYGRTAEAWLKNIDQNREKCIELLTRNPSEKQEASRAYYRWRIFFLSCAELFAFANGQEWGVSHYRFMKPSVTF